MSRHRRPASRRGRVRRRVLAVVLVVASIGYPTAAGALFTSRPSTPSMTATSSTLGPPTALRCTAHLATQASLAWTAPTGMTDPSQLRYTVKRRASGVGSYVALNAIPQVGTTYADVIGVIGSYDYVVSASYRNWTSANSAADTVTFTVVTNTCTA